MKIKAEHYAYLRDALRGRGLHPDSSMRERWDAVQDAELLPYLCANLYSYLNDEHIDTALRAIAREVKP